MTEFSHFKLAAIQAASCKFDREASTEKACQLILDAGAQGAALAAFSESWLPGYPFFVWANNSDTSAVYVEYLANAVEIPSVTTDRLCEAAQRANIDVVIGLAELDKETRGTVYCTLLFISNEGKILGRHRKLKPTDRERTIWGEGDGNSLTVYERPYGRVSGLNCWEHNMVLPGYALMAQGTQIHIAAFPGGPDAATRHLILSRAFASQAGAYVIDVGATQRAEDIVTKAAKDLYDTLDPANESYSGECHLIAPGGEVIAGPVEGETILVAEGSTERILRAKISCDVGGHYSRPDVFKFQVNRAPYRRVVHINDTTKGAVEHEANSNWAMSSNLENGGVQYSA